MHLFIVTKNRLNVNMKYLDHWNTQQLQELDTVSGPSRCCTSHKLNLIVKTTEEDTGKYLKLTCACPVGGTPTKRLCSLYKLQATLSDS